MTNKELMIITRWCKSWKAMQAEMYARGQLINRESAIRLMETGKETEHYYQQRNKGPISLSAGGSKSA